MRASSVGTVVKKTAARAYAPVRKSSHKAKRAFWLCVLTFALGYGAAELRDKAGVEGACGDYQQAVDRKAASR